MYVCTYVCMYVSMEWNGMEWNGIVCMYLSIYLSIYVSMYLCVYICVCVILFLYLITHKAPVSHLQSPKKPLSCGTARLTEWGLVGVSYPHTPRMTLFTFYH